MRLLAVLLIVIAGIALAILPLTGIGLVVAGAIVVTATLIRPRLAIYLLVFAIPFGAIYPLSLGGLSLTAADVLAALLAVAWLARGVALRRITIAHAPIALPLILFLIAQVLSLFGALSLSLAAKEMIKWAEILVVYIVAASVFDEDETDQQVDPGNTTPAASRLSILVALILAASAVEALYGVYQFVFRAGPDSFLIGHFLRSFGTFAQPNPFAGYLNLALPLGFALLLALVQGNAGAGLSENSANHLAGFPRSKRNRIAVLMGWMALVGGGLLMSLSRGAWLGFAAAIVVILLFNSKRSAALGAAGVAILALALLLGSANLLPSALTERFSTITDYFRIFDVRNVKVTDANFAVVERMAHWQAGWAMFNDRPWLGYGIGNYPAAYPQYSLPGWQEPLGHAHNFPLNIAAETGIIGLSAYILFLLAALWTCWRTARSQPLGSLERAVALGVLGILVAKITHEMLDDLWVHGMGMQVAILLAMVYAARRHNTISHIANRSV